ncbi:MAG: amidohydrolase family protein [Woeseiaceae bacterium]
MAPLLCSAAEATRTVSIDTKEITRPDVAVSPDGQSLIFSALGHLHRVAESGGPSTQLTFGPWYDSDPVISPNGDSVVFASDRDGENNGNLFVLDFESGETRQLTTDDWASRPVWSPDGQTISFLSYERRGFWAEYEFIAEEGLLANVRQVAVSGGEPTSLTHSPALIRSAFYLPDGRVGWTQLGGSPGESQAHDVGSHATPGAPVSRILVSDADGTLSELVVIEGVVDRIVAEESGLYVRMYQIPTPGFLVPQPESITYVPFADGEPHSITHLLSPQPRPAFALSNDNIYLGEAGKIWRIDASSGAREAIPVSASIEMELYTPDTAPEYEPTTDSGPASVLDPQLSPDGESLLFTAAGFVWTQDLNGGPAIRINDDDGFQWGAASWSPDGKQIVYQHSEGNLQQLRVADLESGVTRTLVNVDRTGRFEAAWSPDGQSIVYVGFKSMLPSLHLVDVSSGQSRKLVDSYPRWMPRPHFSSDGKFVYYTDRNQLRRYSVDGGAEPEAVTEFSGIHIADATVSPDDKWVAFRQNEEIWVARIGRDAVTTSAARMLTDDGGRNYSFSPDSRSVIYSAGGQVWRQPVDGGRSRELQVQIRYTDPAKPPLLIRNVRVLDLDVGSFSDTVSMLVEDGRIQWVGPESGRRLPSGTAVMDADGRYAIPGLFDAHTHVATPIHFNPARDVSRMSSNVAFGVTSVRDMGSDITLVGAWRDRRQHFGAPVPRIFSGGAMTETAGPFFHGGSFFADNTKQARQIVRKETADGVIAIKSYFTMPWELQRAVADEGRKLGIPVVAHGLTFRETIMGPVLGRSSIEHQPSPIRLYGDVLSLLAASGTRWTPTIAPVGGNGILFAQQPQLLSDPKLRSFTSQGDYALAAEVELFSLLDPKVLGEAYAGLLASVRQGHDLGVKLLTGTDALNPNVFYGHGLHTELGHLASAGIAPIDILRIATIETAELVGAGDELGSLEPGKLADIVLLNEDPLESISNAASIWRVIQDGNVFSTLAKPIDVSRD